MPDCIFCKIVAGEIPSYKVYENEHVYAFLDIHPVNKGHTLVIPKKHARNVFDISEGDWVAVQKVVHLLAGKIEKAVGADGINIRMHNREHGDQDVMHTHVQLIPRFRGDNLRPWPGHPYKKGEADATLALIRASLS